jgi:hypothetical protein
MRTSRSLRDIESLQKAVAALKENIDLVADTAEASDEGLVKIINAQAEHIKTLTLMVVAMHKKLFPEAHNATDSQTVITAH